MSKLMPHTLFFITGIFFFAILILPVANAKSTHSATPVDQNLQQLTKCTKNNYSKVLSKFDKTIEQHFTSKSPTELIAIYNKANIESEALRIFSPFLLRGDVLVNADKDCWADYKNLMDAIRGKNAIKTSTHLERWNSCVEASYHKKLKTVQSVSACIEAGLLK
jgi:hypothetical protein